MKIQESAENYLEMILMLGKDGAAVRAVDIAGSLDFARPSVSVAMKNLREGGYITVDDGGAIALTDAGREIAQRMYERHCLLSAWLVSLGVCEETAYADACRMEHVISAESFDAIKRRLGQHGGK